MKLVFLLLLASCSTYADFVFMKETDSQKSIQLVRNSETSTVNEVSRGEWAIYPDISADGQKIIYAEGSGPEDLHLTLHDLKENAVRRFSSSVKGMILHPKFSKNEKFVFYSGPSAKGKNTIFFFEVSQMKAGSLDQARALDDSEESYFPKPSSDANFVVYQRNVPGKKEIILFDRVENTKTVIAEGMSPALSFDERLIAFTSKKDGNWNIYVFNRDTNKTEQMTSDPADEMAPTFQPDNSLVYATNKSGHYRLVGKNLPVVAEGAWDAYSPQFAGDTSFKQGLRAPYLGNSRSSFGTVVVDDKLYMCGGHQGSEHTYPPESFSDEFLVHDLKTNVWTQLAPRPIKGHGFQMAAHGNYIYAFGAFTYSAEHKPKWKSVSNIDRYDIKLNKWETIGQLKTPRSSNVAITVDEKVYLVGGWDSTPTKPNDVEGTFLDSIEIFDLKTEKSETASYKMPMPLRRAMTGTSYQNKIILVGGLGQGASHFELVRNVTSIDPTTGKSEELAPLPFATFAPAAEVLGDQLYVFGGMFKTGEMNFEYVAHIYEMSFEKKSWRHTGRYLEETKGFSQVFHLDEKTLGILGGHRYFEGQDTPVKTFETFRH